MPRIAALSLSLSLSPSLSLSLSSSLYLSLSLSGCLFVCLCVDGCAELGWAGTKNNSNEESRKQHLSVF